MKKLVVTVLVCMLVCALGVGCFAACAKDTPQGVTAIYKVMSPDGAPTMAIAKMMKDNAIFGTAQGEYQIIGGDRVASSFTSGEADFIIAPTNAGVQLSVKTDNYRLVAVTSWGNLYLVGKTDLRTREECASAQEFMQQFQGKTVDSIGGKEQVPGKTFDKLLALSDVNGEVGTKTNDLILSGLSDGSVELGILGEPDVTDAIKNVQGVKRLADISSLWKEVTGLDFPQAALFVKKSIIEQDKASVTAFLQSLSASIEYLNASSANAKALGEYLQSTGSSKMTGQKVEDSYLRMRQNFVLAWGVQADVLQFVTALGVNITQEKLAQITYQG